MNFLRRGPCIWNCEQPVELRPSAPTGYKEMNSANDLIILEVNSSPVEPPDENEAHPTPRLQFNETLGKGTS